MTTERTTWRLQSWWARATGGLWDLLFPEQCVVCAKFGTLLCPTCLAAIPALTLPVCERCGEPGAHRGSRWPCSARTWRALNGARSAVLYEGAALKIIHRFKYQGGRSLARPLGERLYESWRCYDLQADRIVPVPLHPSRERSRGYNQSQLLAQTLSELSGVGLDVACLKRTRATRPQIGLPPSERLANVQGAFACTDLTVRGQRIMLIDDVMTTASTLEACAAALRAEAARSVWSLTLARAV